MIALENKLKNLNFRHIQMVKESIEQLKSRKTKNNL